MHRLGNAARLVRSGYSVLRHDAEWCNYYDHLIIVTEQVFISLGMSPFIPQFEHIILLRISFKLKYTDYSSKIGRLLSANTMILPAIILV